jgi:hypothetical protein
VAAELDIVNKALSLLGEGLLTSGQLAAPDNDTSRTVAAMLPMARRAVLRDCAPQCARRYATLASAASPPTNPDYAYAYDEPASCLRVLKLLDPSSGSFLAGVGASVVLRWEVAGIHILADYSPLACEYVLDIATTSFDTLLDEALAAYLAGQLAMPLTESRTVAADMRALYQEAKFLAMGADEQEATLERFDGVSGSRLIAVRRY